MAIIHQIRRKQPVRNADTVARLRKMASDRPCEPVTAIERAATRIAEEMAAIHGGRWETKVDHQRRLVMVWCLD
jgi:hypothetical protein